MISPSVTPAAGVTRYQDDFTQGPACAIAAGAATIFRNYFAIVGDQEGQTADRQFDGLADLGKALFSGESVFWVKCSGQGDLFLSSFGAIYEVDIDGTYVVDSGHIVAFEDTLTFRVGKLGDSWLRTFLSGEGLVCHFSGRGKLYCQSHNPPNFGRLLGPDLRPR